MLCKNRIGEYLKVQGGFAFKSSSYQESGIPIIRISNITDRGIILDNICVSTDIMEQTSGYLAEINDSLIAMSGATTGKMGLVSAKNLPALINQRVGRFVYIKNSDKRYFYQLSLSNEFQRQVEINAMGGAQPNISPQKIENIELYIEINTDEQSKIANILSTCDEVIEKTEETIEKYKQIKVGMMQDLFTRGLDENGKLRPTYAQSPDLYKYSEELDRYIPKEWDAKRLDEIATILSGKDYKGNPKGNYNVPIYGTGGIMGYTTIPLYSGPAILTGRKGSINTPYYVEGNFWNVDTIFCLKMLEDNDALWFYYQIYITDMTKYNEATGVPSTTTKTLNKILFAVPKPPEQMKIAESIIKFDKKIEVEEKYLNKYKQIKQGLMKRLLTPPADAEIVEE